MPGALLTATPRQYVECAFQPRYPLCERDGRGRGREGERLVRARRRDTSEYGLKMNLTGLVFRTTTSLVS